MNPIVHAELSWLVAQALPDRRDRRLVVLAGIAPDVDGLSIIAGLESYGRWHHVATHGVAAALVITAFCCVCARRKLVTALLALGVIHLHLLCDLVGSGPGWGITYLWPWSQTEWSWSGAWALNGWQNQVIGFITTLACLGTALPLGRTIVETVSARFDYLVVETIQRRLGKRYCDKTRRPPDAPTPLDNA